MIIRHHDNLKRKERNGGPAHIISEMTLAWISVSLEDYGVIGLRYGSSNFSLGATLMPYSLGDEFPKSAWLVSKIGRLTAGVQYDPKFETKESARFQNLKNWNYAIGYRLGTGSPLSSAFNFSLELAQNSQFIASFYQHVVVQRRLPLAKDVNLKATARVTEGFSGADLQALLSDAQLAAVHDHLNSQDAHKPGIMPLITNTLLQSIAANARPSVSEAEKQRLHNIYGQFLDAKRSAVAAQSREAKGKKATLA